MRMGTKSLLFGAHAFWIHPFSVAIGWWKLYGFPWDPRLWFAFFIHDLGYLGKETMDGPDGKLHPYLGGKIMDFLFGHTWGVFTRRHSRSYSKIEGALPSKLCYADKLAICYIPYWLYLAMAWATGELAEYRSNWKKDENLSAKEWVFKLREAEWKFVRKCYD